MKYKELERVFKKLDINIDDSENNPAGIEVYITYEYEPNDDVEWPIIVKSNDVMEFEAENLEELLEAISFLKDPISLAKDIMLNACFQLERFTSIYEPKIKEEGYIFYRDEYFKCGIPKLVYWNEKGDTIFIVYDVLKRKFYTKKGSIIEWIE